jgi:HSP20 family molecular chaperone IbpA
MPTLVPEVLTALAKRITRLLPGRGQPIPVEDYVADGEYRVRADLPGITADKDLDVTVTDGMLTIHAERAEQRHERQRTEFHYGTLRRSLRLPAGTIKEEITARLADGVLTITMPTGKRVPIEKPAAAGRPVPISHTAAQTKPSPSSRRTATKPTRRTVHGTATRP